MGKLDGKVALISGGARGQGAAEAATFAREGAKVVFGDILDAEGKKVEAAIRAAGGDAAYVHLDVTSETDWQNAVKLATGRHGRLDVLVNNAAIVIPRVAIEDRTAAEWDRVMAVNAKGVFLGTKAAIPEMRRAGGGSIVNISSVAGIGQSLHQEPAYAASKGAIRIFTKVTASQHAKDPLQLRAPRPDRHGDAPQRDARPGGPAPTDGARAARADGHRGRGREARALSRLRRLRLHDRERARHRRRSSGAVIKVMVLLRRPQSWTRERFHRWWLDEHVAHGKKPNLRKYRVCLVTGSTSHEGREPWDGIAELWFDDRAALDRAWSSEVGRTALAHSRESHSDRLVLITEEHELAPAAERAR